MELALGVEAVEYNGVDGDGDDFDDDFDDGTDEGPRLSRLLMACAFDGG